MSETPERRTLHRACNLCEAICGLAITMEGDRILSIRGDEADPLSQGHVCPKAVALQDIHRDPDRLREPMRRTAAGWKRVGWEDALDEVVTRLKEIQRRYSRNAVGVYQGNPTVHNSGTMLFAPLFFRTLRTRNRFSATSVDQLPHHFAASTMFGHQLLLPVPDIDRTDFFLVLGANPLASNGSMMTAPGMAGRLRRLRKRGGRLVVVDPRRTETARVADEHHFIRPGSDAVLLLAMLHTLFAEHLIRPGRLEQFTDGRDTIEQLVADCSPEHAEQATGIDAAAVRRLARDFSAAASAVCYGRIGASTQTLGALSQWLINVLNILTGNLDRPGGAMFTAPAIDLVQRYRTGTRAGTYGRWSSRVRGAPEFGGELPVATLAEEILTEGEGQIRALVTSAGNPVLSTPNGRQLERALAQLKFMVSIDIYVNETTRYAHIILPPTSGLETDHYDVIFHLLAVRNTARYSPAVVEPAAEARHDWQIFHALRRRMEANGRRGRLVARARRAVLDRMTPERMLDVALRTGPYGVWGGRFFSRQGLSIRRLKQEVHGVDLGPLSPCLPERLLTPTGRIQLAPPDLVDHLEQTKVDIFADTDGSDFDLLLIGRRDLRSNNSWMHNSERLVKGRVRCTLLMHPQDARCRNVGDGDTVQVVSRTGTIELPVEVSDDMMPGVVSIPHGWGHDRPDVKLHVARQHVGASINDLTDDRRTDLLLGTAAFSGVPVKIRLG